MVYEPREDSFLLEAAVKKYAKGLVLDMGTGTGILARAAKELGLSVIAVDIDPEALVIGKQRSKGITFIQSNLFENVQNTFDTIIFNHPYLPDAEPSDIALDGGKTGMELLTRFLSEAKDYLTEEGQILLIQSSITGIDKTKRLFLKFGYGWEIITHKRQFFEELMVFRAWVQPNE